MSWPFILVFSGEAERWTSKDLQLKPSHTHSICKRVQRFPTSKMALTNISPYKYPRFGSVPSHYLWLHCFIVSAKVTSLPWCYRMAQRHETWTATSSTDSRRSCWWKLPAVKNLMLLIPKLSSCMSHLWDGTYCRYEGT